MAESVKDLVVRLSFEHGDTKSQIAAIKNEIKLLDSGFKAAAAEAGGFSGALNAAKEKGAATRQQIALLEEAMRKYDKAISENTARIAAAQARQKQNPKLIEDEKKKLKELTKEFKAKDAALEKAKETEGEAAENTVKLQKEYDKLKEAVDKSRKAIKGWEDGLKRADSSIANADKNIQKLKTQQNEARVSLAALTKGTKDYAEAARSAGDAQVKVGQTLSRGSAAIVSAGVASAGMAISWEDSFASVRKTVSGTEEDLQKLEAQLLQMSTEKAVDSGTLAEIAANAGQLGVSSGMIEAFTATMADLTATTNLAAEEGASQFAKFRNITGMLEENYSRLGSSVVDLGNNMATTEADIMSMAMRIAAAGTTAKMTQPQIVSIAAALSSIGLEAEAGGTAFSGVIQGMQVAAETGSDDLKKYANIAGMSAESFAAAFREDAAGAFMAFIKGLSSGSQSAIVMLDEMGITQKRTLDALLRSTEGYDLFADAIEISNKAWDENTALAAEASVRYGTTASKLTMLGNKAKAAAVNFGKELTPAIEEGIDWASEAIEKFAAMDDETKSLILTVGKYAAAVGPVVLATGKLNQGVGKLAGGLAALAEKSAAAGGGLKGVLSAVGGLLGPAGVPVLAAALGFTAYKFAEWATGARAAKEATEDMLDVAQRMKETQAATLYDTGTADPLARFGVDKSAFASATASAESWLNELIQVWTDGEKETDEILSRFTEGFTSGSDGVRAAIEGRKELLEGLGVEGAGEALGADLAQLEAWDKEVADLLKKRQNGFLTEDEKARLAEVVQLRAELEFSYTGGEKDGFDQVMRGMRSALDRAALDGETDFGPIYGDALNALAEGRRAYNDALAESYDAQYAEIELIEDAAQREAALAALQQQYSQQKLEGEQEYQKAVQEAAAGAFEHGGYEEQVQQLYNLAAELGGNKDLVDLSAWTDSMDEGKMASMLALLEQLKESGTESMEINGELIDIADIQSKLQLIRDELTGLDGAEGLQSIFTEALPEEMRRIAVSLDMEQADADWAAFAEGKNPWEVGASIKLNPLDDAAISAWEAENGSIELTGTAAKIGVTLGPNWLGKINSEMDASMLRVYGADGKLIPVTPEILEQITDTDVAAYGEDGTLHVWITPEIGSIEGVEASRFAMEDKPFAGTWASGLTQSTQDSVDRIVQANTELDKMKAKLAEMKQNGEWVADDGTMVGDLEGQVNGATDLVDALQNLSEVDLANIGSEIVNLGTALANGTLIGEDAEKARMDLEALLSVVALADTYLKSGNQVSAGIAAGMKEYGWEGDAESVAGAVESAINGAFQISSPAGRMIPSGGYISAGIGLGMTSYDFAGEAAAIMGAIVGAFDGMQGEGVAIGAAFGDGLKRGLESKMRSSLAAARSYAAQITAAFRSAWKIHSPSRVAEGLTGMFGEGLEKGMRKWPTVSERLLNDDLQRVHGGYRQINENVTNHETYNQQRTVNVNVDSLQVRDEADVLQLAREMNRLERVSQRGKGKW